MRFQHLSIVITLACIGLVDAAYLSYSRFTTNPLSCNILEGCNIVALSPYSVLFGIIPLAYLGLVFYTAVVVLGALYLRTQQIRIYKALLAAGGLGFISSAYFVYIQAFVIKAFCVYCIFSAALASAVFVFLLHHAFVSRRGTDTQISAP